MSDVTLNLYIQVKLYDLGEDHPEDIVSPEDAREQEFEDNLNEAFELKRRFYFAYAKPDEDSVVRRVIPTFIKSNEHGLVRFGGYDLDRREFRQFLANRVDLVDDTAVADRQYEIDEGVLDLG